MGVDVDKAKKHLKKEKKKRAEREERRKSQTQWMQSEAGKNCIGIVCPHENMDNMPFQERGVHRNCGPDGKLQFNCRRDNDDDPVSKCPQCEENSKLYASKNKLDKKRASKRRRDQRYYFPVIDLGPLLDDDVSKMPKCFIDYPDDNNKKARKKRGCKNCDWQNSCEKGIMTMSAGKTIYNGIMDEFADTDSDITNPKKFYPIKFEKTQEDPNDPKTIRYSNIKAMKKPIRLPNEVAAKMEENTPDLKLVGTPKSKEEMKALMAGIQMDTQDDDDDDIDNPDCWGEYKAKQKKCKKCAVKDECEVETDGDVDEEEEKKKTKKKKGKKASKKKPDHDDEEEEDEEDDEDEEEDEDEEDKEEEGDEEDDEDEEEDDEEEDDEEDEKSVKKKKGKSKKKKAKKDEEEEEDEEEDDEEEEDEEEEDEEEEDEEEEDEEEEDEEEEDDEEEDDEEEDDEEEEDEEEEDEEEEKSGKELAAELKKAQKAKNGKKKEKKKSKSKKKK